MIKELLKRIGQAFKSVFSGLYFIHYHMLWKYVSFPIMITAAIAFFLKAGIASGASLILAKVLSKYLYQLFPILDHMPFSITPALSFLIFWPIYWLLSFIMTFFYNLVGSIIWSFFSSPLQERVELITTGKMNKAPFQNTVKWSFISLWDAVKDILLFLALFALSFAFLFIPIAGMGIQFIFMTLVNSFFIGQNNLRAALCNRAKSLKERNQTIYKKYLPECVGIGLPEVIAAYMPVFAIFVFFFVWSGSLVASMRLVAKKEP